MPLPFFTQSMPFGASVSAPRFVPPRTKSKSWQCHCKLFQQWRLILLAFYRLLLLLDVALSYLISTFFLSLQWSVGHRALFSAQLCLQLAPPSSSNCSAVWAPGPVAHVLCAQANSASYPQQDEQETYQEMRHPNVTSLYFATTLAFNAPVWGVPLGWSP